MSEADIRDSKKLTGRSFIESIFVCALESICGDINFNYEKYWF